MKAQEVYKLLANWGSFRNGAEQDASKFDFKKWAVDLSTALAHMVDEYEDFQTRIASAIGWDSNGKPFDKHIADIVANNKVLKALIKDAYLEGYGDGHYDWSGDREHYDEEMAWFKSNVRKDIEND